MSSAAPLADLERLRDVRQRELDVLEARLEEAQRTLTDVESEWGRAPARLPLRPVAAVLAAVLASNAAVLSAYFIVLTGCRNEAWNGAYLLHVLVALAALPFTGARLGLRRIAIAFLLVSLAEVLYAVWNLEGVGFPLR